MRGKSRVWLQPRESATVRTLHSIISIRQHVIDVAGRTTFALNALSDPTLMARSRPRFTIYCKDKIPNPFWSGHHELRRHERRQQAKIHAPIVHLDNLYKLELELALAGCQFMRNEPWPAESRGASVVSRFPRVT